MKARKTPVTIHQLPPEILGVIFEHTLPGRLHGRLPTPRLSPLLLTHVSSIWRKIAQGCPHLWTGLQLTRFCKSPGPANRVRYINGPAHLRSVEELFISQVRFWLSRLPRPFKLSLALEVPRVVGEHHLRVALKRPRTWEALIATVFTKYALRIRFICLSEYAHTTSDPTSYFLSPSAGSQAGHHFSALDTLTLEVGDHFFERGDTRFTRNTFPALRKLHIKTTQLLLRREALPSFPWEQLTHLSISTALPAPVWIRILKAAHSLIECTMHITSTETSWLSPSLYTDFPGQQLRVLQNMTTLNVTCGAFSAFILKYFKVPNLTNLVIHSDIVFMPMAQSNEIESILLGLAPQLYHLTLAGKITLEIGKTLCDLSRTAIHLKELVLRMHQTDVSHQCKIWFDYLSSSSLSDTTGGGLAPELQYLTLYIPIIFRPTRAKFPLVSFLRFYKSHFCRNSGSSHSLGRAATRSPVDRMVTFYIGQHHRQKENPVLSLKRVQHAMTRGRIDPSFLRVVGHDGGNKWLISSPLTWSA